MAVINGFTAEHMESIRDNVVVDGSVIGNNLILVKQSGAQINAGNVRGPAGTNGVDGNDGAPGAPGPPGTSGIWYRAPIWEDDTIGNSVDPINTTYKTIVQLTVPSAAFARTIVLFGQMSFLGLSTGTAIYRAAIKDALGVSLSHAPWYCPVAGVPGFIHLSTSPIPLTAGGGTRTYSLDVRRDTGSGGQIDHDAKTTKFSAFVCAS